MKPGHGEVLIAEGDPEVSQEELELIEAFREQLDNGMWAAVPLTGPAGRWIGFLRVPEPKAVKNRMHLCVRPVDRTRDEEVERLLALGATMVDDLREESSGWAVLADPEGNEFCVLSRRER